MQTFLPYPDFEETAAVLDTRRLGKQRVETMQVLRALTRERYGWKHHPAVRMWAGWEEALASYGLTVCREWQRRGFADTCEATILGDFRQAGLGQRVRAQSQLAELGLLPPWLGQEDFHRSHRSALLRKDPEHYQPHFPDEAPDLEYVWPSRDGPSSAAHDSPASR